MPRLIAALIRHGDYKQRPDTPSAHQPFPLTDEGRTQSINTAVDLCDMLDRHNWTLSPAVDSSHLLRAWQTAQIIIESLADRFPSPAKLTGFDALAERGLGSAANLTISEIETIIRDDPRFPDLPADWKSNSRFRLPLQGAESLLDAGERVAAHIKQQMKVTSESVKSDTLKLFIGHGAAFRHAAYHLGVLRYEQIVQLSMYHARPVYIEYISGGAWQHIAGEWKVRTKFNEYTD